MNENGTLNMDEFVSWLTGHGIIQKESNMSSAMAQPHQSDDGACEVLAQTLAQLQSLSQSSFQQPAKIPQQRCLTLIEEMMKVLASMKRQLVGEDDHEYEAALPQALAEWVPIMKSSSLPDRCKELALLESPCQDPQTITEPDVQALRGKIQQTLSEAEQIIHTKSLDQHIISACDKVINAGNADFRGVYEAVWHRIENSEQDGLHEYQSACDRLGQIIDSNCSSTSFNQQHSDVVDLYLSATRARGLFENFINKCTGVNIKCGPLKKTSRILEKLLLTPRQSGQDLDASRICDIVRGMGEAPSVGVIAKAVNELADHPDIICLRMKDRLLSAPSPGGWRDVSVALALIPCSC